MNFPLRFAQTARIRLLNVIIIIIMFVGQPINMEHIRS